LPTGFEGNIVLAATGAEVDAESSDEVARTAAVVEAGIAVVDGKPARGKPGGNPGRIVVPRGRGRVVEGTCCAVSEADSAATSIGDLAVVTDCAKAPQFKDGMVGGGGGGCVDGGWYGGKVGKLGS